MSHRIIKFFLILLILTLANFWQIYDRHQLDKEINQLEFEHSVLKLHLIDQQETIQKQDFLLKNRNLENLIYL